MIISQNHYLNKILDVNPLIYYSTECLTILGTAVSTIIPGAVGAVLLQGGPTPRAALVGPAHVVGCGTWGREDRGQNRASGRGGK